MMLSAVEVLLLGLVGGGVALDRTAFLQLGLARPLVAAPLAGTILGAPGLGLWCGVLLELLWLTEVPVGAAVPPDEALIGVLGAVFAWAAPAVWDVPARAAAGVLLALPCGYLGRLLDVGVRRWNAGLGVRVRDRVGRGEPAGLGVAQLLGAARFFAAGALAAVVGVVFGTTLLGQIEPLLPVETEQALALVAVLLPTLGAAAMLGRWGGGRQAFRFVVGAAAWSVAPPLGKGGLWPR